jgi:hypothetical protein
VGSLHLTAWGRLEVESSADIAPGGQSPFYVDYTPLADRAEAPRNSNFHFTPKIEKAGVVIFEPLLPDTTRVGTFHQADSEAMEVMIEPGKTERIELEKEVQPVSGRLQAGNADGVIWERQRASLILRLPRPPWPKNLTIHERRQWLEGWRRPRKARRTRNGKGDTRRA